MRNRAVRGQVRGAPEPLGLEPVRPPRRAGRRPVERLGAGHRPHEVAALHRRDLAGLVHQLVGIGVAGGDDPAHRPRRAQLAGQRPRVDAGDGHDPVVGQVVAQGARRPPVARDGRRLADDEAGHLGAARLDVLARHPVVADLGARHGDDLPGVGGVGQHLLVAGHARVEHDLAPRDAARAGGGTAGTSFRSRGPGRRSSGGVGERCGHAGLGCGGDLHGGRPGAVAVEPELDAVGARRDVRDRRRRLADEPLIEPDLGTRRPCLARGWILPQLARWRGRGWAPSRRRGPYRPRRRPPEPR